MLRNLDMSVENELYWKYSEFHFKCFLCVLVTVFVMGLIPRELTLNVALSQICKCKTFEFIPYKVWIYSSLGYFSESLYPH